MTQVRAATPHDLDDVASLDARLFPDDAWDHPAWQGLVATSGRRLQLAVEEESSNAEVRVVGYVLTGVAGDFADLLRIGTDPSQRRLGVATRLLEWACRQAGADGAERLLLEVSEANAAARALYEAAGFTEIDRRPGYYRDGSAALVLARALTSDAHTSERMDP